MRTAEEWVRLLGINSEVLRKMNEALPDSIYAAINEARKEAIEECAERADVDGFCESGDNHCIVNKQSILSLISELK